MQGISCCWSVCSDTVVMYDAKLISDIVSLSVVLLASTLFVLLLLLQCRVSSQPWKTWSMQVALIKLVCIATYLTIVVTRSDTGGKISVHLIDIVRCFSFALVAIAEMCNLLFLLNVSWNNSDRSRTSGSFLDLNFNNAFRSYNMQYEVPWQWRSWRCCLCLCSAFFCHSSSHSDVILSLKQLLMLTCILIFERNHSSFQFY